MTYVKRQVNIDELNDNAMINELRAWASLDGVHISSEGIVDRVVVDMLRHGIVQLGNRGDSRGTIDPVHIVALLAFVRNQIQMMPVLKEKEISWTDEDETSPIRASEDRETPIRCLRVLKTLGEVIHCGNGYYRAIPTREVSLTSGERILLSGYSSEQLKEVYGRDIKWCGFARQFRDVNKGKQSVPEQPLKKWLEGPEQAIGKWISQRLSLAEKSLEPAISDSESGLWDVYDATSTRSQFKRWRHLRQWQPRELSDDGLWLCRVVDGAKKYYLAKIAATINGPRITHLSDVSTHDHRHVMYGMDHLNDNCVKATWLPSRFNGVLSLTLENWPTRELLKLLTAVGYRVERQRREPANTNYSLEFEVASTFKSDISLALSDLGIVINEIPSTSSES